VFVSVFSNQIVHAIRQPLSNRLFRLNKVITYLKMATLSVCNNRSDTGPMIDCLNSDKHFELKKIVLNKRNIARNLKFICASQLCDLREPVLF
jgi:hypothetical protein